MGSAVEALLLDAVGTLIHLREPPARVYVRVARSHGIDVDPQHVNRALSARLARHAPPSPKGVPLHEIPSREREGWRAVVREVLGDLAADGPCFDSLFELYGAAQTWEVAPLVSAALDHTRARGIRLALVSNMDARIITLLEELGLTPKLDAIVIPSNCGWVKPDPGIFQVAVERLGVPLQAGLYIGDHDVDCVDAARAAGLRALRYDPEADPHAPDALRSWEDLPNRLAR